MPEGRAAPVLPLPGGARLRPLAPEDRGALLGWLSDPEVTARTSYPEVTPALVDAIIARAAARWAAGEPAKWGLGLGDPDALIGTCGFSEASATHRWAELTFDLARPRWGQGWMGAAVRAALRWGFAEGGLERVHAHVRVDNARSRRLLERLGFRWEGRLRSLRWCRGAPWDFDLYALLRDDPSAHALLAGPAPAAAVRPASGEP